jgi:hypothetical protein
LALNCSDPRWTPLMQYISTQTFSGYGCFVLIDRYRYTYRYRILLLVPFYSISPVCGMYTMFPRPTLQLACSIYPFRPLSSCSPHWNSTILSVPACSASTVPISFLASCFLVCFHACLLLGLAFYPLPPPTFQPPLLPQNVNGFPSWLADLSLYSAFTLPMCLIV